MSETVLKKAKEFYPEYWKKSYIDALLKKGKLTKEEYDEIIKKEDEINEH